MKSNPKPLYEIVYSTGVKLIPNIGNAVEFENRGQLIDFIRESRIASQVSNLSCLPQTLRELARTPFKFAHKPVAHA